LPEYKLFSKELSVPGFRMKQGFHSTMASRPSMLPTDTLLSGPKKNQEDERTITNEMDPKGYLKKAAGNAYIHTEENEVRYFEMCEDIGGLR